jgi:SAM-dependent methyltransferase
MSGPPGELCVLCGSNTAQRGPAGQHHRLWECESCAMIHIRPMPPEGKDIHQSSNAERYAQAVDPLRKGFQYHHIKLLNLLIRRLKKPGRLLEVGCNRGEFLNVAKSMGFDVLGVEPASGAASRVDGVPILNEPIERVALPQNQFDAAVAIQVIEHVRDPSVLLEQMLKSLKPGGVIYLETPNYGSLARRWGSSRFMNLNVAPGHWHLFNADSIRFLLERHGMQPIKVWTFYKALSAYGRGAARVALVEILNRTVGLLGLANTLAVLAQKRSGE